MQVVIIGFPCNQFQNKENLLKDKPQPSNQDPLNRILPE